MILGTVKQLCSKAFFTTAILPCPSLLLFQFPHHRSCLFLLDQFPRMRLLFFPTFRNDYIVFPCSEYFWKTAEAYIPSLSLHKTPRKSAGLQCPAIAWLLCLQPTAFSSRLLASCRKLHSCVSPAALPEPCERHRRSTQGSADPAAPAPAPELTRVLQPPLPQPARSPHTAPRRTRLYAQGTHRLLRSYLFRDRDCELARYTSPRETGDNSNFRV